MNTKIKSDRAFFPDKKNGGGVVLDESRYNRDVAQIEKIDKLLNDLSGELAWWKAEPDGEFLLRVYRNGVSELNKIAEERFEDWALAHDCPQFLLEDGRRRAVEAVPADLVERVNTIIEEIHFINKEMTVSISDSELKYDKNSLSLKVGDGYVGRLWESCADRVAAEDVADAQKLCEMLEGLREIDARGYDVWRIIRRYIGNRYDDPAKLPKIDPMELLVSMRRYPYKVLTRDEAEKAGTLNQAIVAQGTALNELNQLSVNIF